MLTPHYSLLTVHSSLFPIHCSFEISKHAQLPQSRISKLLFRRRYDFSNGYNAHSGASVKGHYYYANDFMYFNYYLRFVFYNAGLYICIQDYVFVQWMGYVPGCGLGCPVWRCNAYRSIRTKMGLS